MLPPPLPPCHPTARRSCGDATTAAVLPLPPLPADAAAALLDVAALLPRCCRAASAALLALPPCCRRQPTAKLKESCPAATALLPGCLSCCRQAAAAAAKNSERKSNDANGSSEGGEDIFPGCRKERAGEAAEAEMGQDPPTKSVPC
jgi:hypothetical protein